MIRLLRIEINKLRTFRAFWILMIMYVLGLSLTLILFETILNGFFKQALPQEALMAGLEWDINSFPTIWQFETFFGGFFHYILSVIIIILICNEFNYKTIRQNIISGMSREEFLFGKLLLIGALAFAATLLVFLICLGMGFLNSEAYEIGRIFFGMSFIPAFFVQAVGYMMLAFVIGMLVRRTGIAIGITLLYQVFVEKVILLTIYQDFQAIKPVFPVESSATLIPFPFQDFMMGSMPNGPEMDSLGFSLGYILLFFGISYWYIRKRDL